TVSENMSDDEVAMLIFAPGFSTATSFNTTHYEDKDRDNQIYLSIYLSISLPFGNGGRVATMVKHPHHIAVGNPTFLRIY
ncbi:hypothetical protein O5833_29210, partial [Escherichia coli]|nr:hypothetical protein [Escherichia coli]